LRANCSQAAISRTGGRLSSATHHSPPLDEKKQDSPIAEQKGSGRFNNIRFQKKGLQKQATPQKFPFMAEP
jgi:hypothetical protein